MKKSIFFLFSLLFPLFSDAARHPLADPVPQEFLKNPLRDRLKGARNGDFVVTEANKITSLLIIRSLTPQSLIVEEISVPSNSLPCHPISWTDWLKNRAPGHTSWTMMEIDLSENQVLECYSFSKAAWIQLSERENFFSTLLNLPLKPIPKEDQKRIGPPPSGDEPDHRSLWKPPLIVEGVQQHHPDFEVYASFWPKDGSELSGTQLSIYFDRSRRTPFPVWIQIDTAHATAPLRVIDSGKNLPEIHRSLPRRVPQFVNTPQKTPAGIKFFLKTPKYYKSFDLFAVDVTTRNRKIYPVTHSLVQGEGEVLQVVISQEDLLQTLEPNHRYTWLIVPTGHSEYYSESLKPFLWKLDE